MVTMYRAATWKIAVYGAEHGLPHFHIEGRDFRCSVAIATRELIVGEAPRVIFRAAVDWAADHEQELMDKWRELNP
jgi:hypothetical protein